MKPWAALCEHVTAGDPWKPTKDPGTLIFLPVITCKKTNPLRLTRQLSQSGTDGC